jgi:hypothetical protein
MKEKIVFGIGIMAIILVAALIVMGNNQCSDDQSIADQASSDMLLQQKDVAIAKLIKHINTKQAELLVAKAKLGEAESKLDANNAILEGAKKKIETIKEEASSPIEAKISSKK